VSRAGAAAAALSLATGIDLFVAAATGYPLRTDAALLAALDAVLLAPFVLPILATLAATSWMRRAPRMCIALAALAPVVALAGVRATGARGLGLAIGGPAAVLAALLAVDVRGRRGAPRGAELAAAVALGGVLVVLAVMLPRPGRDQLNAPEPRIGAVAADDAPNLLVIVLDTLRADHTGLLGYARPTTPWLDAFAARATVFPHAVSSSSWTLPAHATLFTGLFPRAHGADLIEGEGGTSLAALGRLEDIARAHPLSPAATTLAELAQQADVDTGAICANTAYLYRFFGLDQGFRTYVDAPGTRPSARPLGLSVAVGAGTWFRRDHDGPRPDAAAATPVGEARTEDAASPPRGLRAVAEWGRRRIQSNERYYLLASEVNDLALRWLAARRDRRFFLFLNYMDPHAPYLPIGRYRGLFPAADAPQSVDLDAIRERRRAIRPQERGPLVDAYDAEIRYLDDHLRMLFAQLEAWGLLDRTVVLIVADHGESFGEHNEMGHGNGVYESEVHVPLLLRVPGQREGTRVERLVHLVDAFPTLVDLAGLPRPPLMQGVSLLGEATRPLPPVVYAGRYHDLVRDHPRWYDRTHQALYQDAWKLVARSDGTTELYDVRTDPEETRDRAADEAGRVRDMRTLLAAFDAAVGPLFGSGTEAMSPEALERLRALGYVQ
jgi:arylsulfatase A-like enzyme